MLLMTVDRKDTTLKMVGGEDNYDDDYIVAEEFSKMVLSFMKPLLVLKEQSDYRGQVYTAESKKQELRS